MQVSPLIIGHRGASAFAPENTLAAFQMAIDTRADGLEFDVQLAADGVPVVIHDPSLRRTASRRELVSGLTSSHLASVDVGSWFNLKFPHLASADYPQQFISTLANVLDKFKNFAGLLYVEMKPNKNDDLELAEAVCGIIRDSGLLPQIIVKSFDLAAIREARRLLPAVQTAALFSPKIVDLVRPRQHIITRAQEVGADQISVHHSLVNETLKRLAADANLPLTTWTVNDPLWLKRHADGINAVITNDPERLLAAREHLR